MSKEEKVKTENVVSDTKSVSVNSNIKTVTPNILLGIDIGNAYCKTSSGIRFLSRVSSAYGKSYTNNAHNLEWNNEKYLVGDIDGMTFTKSDKYTTNEYKATLLTAILLSVKDMDNDNINIYLSLGTPVEQYDECKEICRQTAIELGTQTITVDKITKTINIKDAIVVPQSAIIGDKNVEDLPSLVIDFGGGTLDVSVWDIDDNGVPYKTYAKSMPEYSFDIIIEKFRNKIRTAYSSEISYTDAISLLDNPIKTSKVSGEINYSSEVNSILSDYAKMIYSTLKQNNLPTLLNTVYCIGGCGNLMKPYIEKAFGFVENSITSDKEPQFSNVVSYYEVGKYYYTARGINGIK